MTDRQLSLVMSALMLLSMYAAGLGTLALWRWKYYVTAIVMGIVAGVFAVRFIAWMFFLP